jgi:hypothetical protein
MESPVNMEKQQAVLRGPPKYAGQFGVTIEERPRPPYNYYSRCGSCAFIRFTLKLPFAEDRKGSKLS